MKIRSKTACIAIGAGLLAAGPAWADEGGVLDVIIVTASKIDRPAEKLEGFVATAGAADLERQGLRAVDDLQRSLPGLSFHQRGTRAYDNVTLRGQSSVDFYSPKVQIYLDGLLEDQALFSRLLPATVSRIEALYGPQGTLYGRGAVGGVVNVVTHKPGEGPNFALSGAWDEVSRFASAAAGGAIVKDSLFADVSGGWLDSDGEYSELGTGVERGQRTDWNMRGRLRYAPAGSPWDVTVLASHVDIGSNEEQYVPAALVEDRISYPLENDLDLEANRFGLIGSYDFGGVTLTALTSYQDRDMDRIVFGAASPESQQTFSQEIRLSSNPATGSVFAYVVGVYFEDVHFEFERPDYGQVSVQDLQDMAAFGELVWSASERFDVTVGLRADRHKAKARGTVPGLDLSDEEDFTALTPKIALGWDATDTIRLYALYSTGFKPGGFTRIVTPGIVSFSYEPETVDNFELGGRASFFGNAVRIAAAAYWMENDDFQLYVGVQPNQYLQNVGEARSRGIDVSVDADLTRRLFINTSLTYNRAEFTAYDNPQTPGHDLTGNRMPHGPGFKANIDIGYELDLPSRLGQLTPSFQLSHVSDVYFDETNTVGQSGFSLYGLNLTWRTPWNVDVSGYVSNLTDKTYRVYGFNGGPGFGELYQLGQGRSAGARIQASF